MATIVELDGVAPSIGEDVFLAPTAMLVGDTAIIWFGTVLRGDSSHIEDGEESSIQDNAAIHCAKGLPTIVGARVTVTHGALLARRVRDRRRDGAQRKTERAPGTL